MRGRLHHKFYAEIAMLAAKQTRATDPDGAGPLTGGFDDDFNEILVFTQSGQRQEARRDEESVFVPCNVRTQDWEALQQFMAGNAPDTHIILVVHRKDLERMELINPDRGEPLIRASDRIVSFRDDCHRILFQPRSPFYVTEVRPEFGIAKTPDIFNIVVEDRENFPKS